MGTSNADSAAMSTKRVFRECRQTEGEECAVEVSQDFEAANNFANILFV
jgi:hypothetical protein